MQINGLNLFICLEKNLRLVSCLLNSAMATRSAIWNYFTPLENNADKAKCNTCHQEYSCKCGNTSPLINHLKSKHKDVYEMYETISKKRPGASSSQSKPISCQTHREEYLFFQ